MATIKWNPALVRGQLRSAQQFVAHVAEHVTYPGANRENDNKPGVLRRLGFQVVACSAGSERHGMTKEFRELMLDMGASAVEAIAAGVPRLTALEAVGRTALTIGNEEAVAKFGPSIALAWAECGFPTVEPSHKLAASLIATTIPPEFVDEFVRMPWRCFGFHVPAGVMGDNAAFALALHSHSGLFQLLSWSGHEFGIGFEKSLADWNLKIVSTQVSDHAFTPQDIQRSQRESEVLGRLFLGICAEMSSYRPSDGGSGGGGVRRDKRNRPIPSTFKLTRDVRVDTRQAVRDYVAGRTNQGPSVQILVRGHWKAQAYGPGLVSRKMIHIEPYWRGPEDSPAAVRTHRVGEE